MKIKVIEESDIEKYYELASNYGTIFNSKEWHFIFNKKIDLIGIYSEEGDLIGGAHFQILKIKGIFKYCRVPFFTPNIGLFYKNTENVKKSTKISIQSEISEAFIKYLDREKYLLTIFSFPPTFLFLQNFYWNKFKVIPRYTYHIDLTKDLDEILFNFSKGKLKDIKRAKKDSLSTILSFDYSLVKELVYNTFNRQGKAFQNELMEDILFKFANESNSFSYITWENGVPVSASFCIFDNNTAYYLLGGYDNKNKHSAAGVQTIVNCIEHSKRLGLNVFDFEGSMVPAIEKYFRGFGGELVPSFSVNKAWLPIEFVLKCFKRQLF